MLHFENRKTGLFDKKLENTKIEIENSTSVSESKAETSKSISSEGALKKQVLYSRIVKENPQIVILPTALVKFVCHGVIGTVRVLLNSCSQATLIADSFVKKSKLPSKKLNISSSIVGVGNIQTNLSSIVDLQLKSVNSDFKIDIREDVIAAEALQYSPSIQFSSNILENLRKLNLPDLIYKQPKCEISKNKLRCSKIKTVDFNNNLKVIIRYQQKLSFLIDVEKLEKGLTLKRRSPLRTHRSIFRFRQKYTDKGSIKQLNILGRSKVSKCPFALLMVTHLHKKYFHESAKFLPSYLVIIGS